MSYQNDAEESSKDVKFVLVLSTAVLIFLSIILLCFAAPYQSYKKDHCQICFKSVKQVRLVVHHIDPQHLHPELANDHPENYITLCDPVFFRSKGCHWKFGHRGINWSYDNSGMMKVIVGYLNTETNSVGKGQGQ